MDIIKYFRSLFLYRSAIVTQNKKKSNERLKIQDAYQLIHIISGKRITQHQQSFGIKKTLIKKLRSKS